MSRLYDVLEKLSETAIVDYGTTDGWSWIKYADGRYEAERYIDIGDVTAGTNMATIEGNVKLYMSGAIPTSNYTPPHTLTAGRVIYDLVGNATGYAMVFRTTSDKIQIGRFATAEPTFNHVKITARVINGRWK